MTITQIKPTKAIARKVLQLVDCGLVHGLGIQEPGKMCIEAAVCHAFGLPHGDNPPCVGSRVRSFKIALNDSTWSSDKIRAKGLRRLAIAQLGSNDVDQERFSKLLALRVTQKLLPDALLDYAKYCKKEYVEKLSEIAASCEQAKTDNDVSARLASLDRLDILDSRDSLARLASLDILDILDSLASLARLASLDKFLCAVAEVAVGVLVEMETEGSKWLDLAPL